MSFVVRSRRVLLEEAGRLVIQPALIRVTETKIERVERLDSAAYEAERRRKDPDVLELDDLLITPAFVNAHTHLALAFLRGIDADAPRPNLVENLFFHYESRLSAEDIRAFSRMGAYESLACGVGFVWDHYYGGTALADALVDTGLAGAVAPTLQDLSGPGASDWENALAATLEIAGKASYRERGVLAALGPHATDTVSAALFTRIAELAERERLPVHLHVAQSLEELARVSSREGCSPVQVLARSGLLARAPSLVMAHGLFVPRADLALLDATRHTLVHCPSSQLEFAFAGPAAMWSDAGARWVIATDCAASNDSMNLQKELRLARGAATATITGSAAYERFLESGSLEAAQQTMDLRNQRTRAFAPHADAQALLARALQLPGTLHPALRTGVLAEGALASFIAWDTDHPAFFPEQDLVRGLAMSDTLSAMHTLFVAGKRIGHAGDVTGGLLASDDYREAKLEACERFTHLMSANA